MGLMNSCCHAQIARIICRNSVTFYLHRFMGLQLIWQDEKRVYPLPAFQAILRLANW